MNHKKAILLTVCVAVLWSLAGLNIKMISWPPYAIAGGRSVIASILLYPLLKRGGNIKIDKYVIGGALCYASFNYCFNISTKLASSAIAIMMQYTAPIYVAILAWIFLKEKITKADIISLVVSLRECCFSLWTAVQAAVRSERSWLSSTESPLPEIPSFSACRKMGIQSCPYFLET